MNIETILVRARALVAQGLLHDRECSSAETIHKKLVRYTDPRAVRFSPAAAVFRAEHDLRKESKRVWKPLDTEVLRLLSKHGSMSVFYRNAKTLDDVLERFDKTKNEILELAKQLVEKEHIYIIGKHINHAAAMECALKIKETSYIHAESFAAGELKHGVIALIEQGTPCIVIGSNDNLTGEIRSSAAELKARGATIIGIAPFEATEFDQHIKTPDLGDLTVFPNIVVGQLLGYFAAIGRGADPDKPRNLAKSVTVK